MLKPKYLNVLWIVCGLISSVHDCRADISKAALHAKIASEAESTLRALAISDDKQSAVPKISPRLATITAAIDDTPQETLDDDGAQWIEQSVLHLINVHGHELIRDDKFSDRRANELYHEMSVRLKDFTKVQQGFLLQRRSRLVAASNKFSPLIAALILDRLSRAKTIRLSLSPEATSDRFGSNIAQIVRGLELDDKSTPYYNRDFAIKGDISVVRDALDSQLLSLVLLHETRSLVLLYEKSQSSDIANLFSRVYETHPDFADQPKEFTVIRNQLLEELNHYIYTSSGITNVNMTGIYLFLVHSDYIRFGAKFDAAPTFNSTAPNNNASVTFVNNSNAWMTTMHSQLTK